MHITDSDLVQTLSEQVGDDPLQAAVYARIHTGLSFTHWLGPLGNYLIARPAARHAAHAETEKTEVPLDAAVVLGLGARELHVWSADPMRSDVGDALGTVALQRITGLASEVGQSWSPLSITLDDGQVVELEARGDVSGFVRAFEAR